MKTANHTQRIMAVLALLAVLGATGWIANSVAARVGEHVMMAGTLSCAACKLGGSPDHVCGKECCTGCIKGGDSILLEDGEGNLYLLISTEKDKPVLPAERLDLVGEKVLVTGVKVEKGGLKGIYVERIESAAEHVAPGQTDKPKGH